MNNEVEVVETPCIHADKDGYCTQESNMSGAKCCHCMGYSPVSVLQSAIQTSQAFIDQLPDEDGPIGNTMPATLTVRHHKHIVNVPVAQALTQQYERVNRVTNAALREMVMFGAMLDRIDKALGANRYANRDRGQGVSLKSWLADNCPDIEYATAMDYKRTTKNYMSYMQLKEDTPLLEMMQADPYDDEQKEQLRRRILDSMTGLTKGQLRRITDQKAGNPMKGTVGIAAGRRAIPEAEQAQRAAADMRELCGHLQAFIFEGTQISLLTIEELDEFANQLKLFARKVNDIAAEG